MVVIGGYMLKFFSWRILFYSNAPFVAAMMPIAYIVLPEKNKNRTWTKRAEANFDMKKSLHEVELEQQSWGEEEEEEEDVESGEGGKRDEGEKKKAEQGFLFNSSRETRPLRSTSNMRKMTLSFSSRVP